MIRTKKNIPVSWPALGREELNIAQKVLKEGWLEWENMLIDLSIKSKNI